MRLGCIYTLYTLDAHGRQECYSNAYKKHTQNKHVQKQNKECSFVGYKIYYYHKNARSNTYQSYLTTFTTDATSLLVPASLLYNLHWEAFPVSKGGRNVKPTILFHNRGLFRVELYLTPSLGYSMWRCD
jgi:hypothetical protein